MWYEETTKISVEKQILIIVPQYPVDSGTEDIEALLGKMDAQVAVDGGFDRGWRVGRIEIRCQTSDKASAETLLKIYGGSYEEATGKLSLAPFRFYPIRDVLKSIRDLETYGCENIVFEVMDMKG